MIIKPIIPYIIMFKNYKRMREEKTNILNPTQMAKAINEYLRDAYGALVKDMEAEGVNSVEQLKVAKNFLAFCEKNKESVEGFGHFIGDHRGFYDKMNQLYNWQNLWPYTEAIFRFNVKMPNKARLLEITGKRELAPFAMKDDNVVRFVLENFDTYAYMPKKALDEHGRQVSILEMCYLELYRRRQEEVFPLASPAWALETLIKELIYQ